MVCGNNLEFDVAADRGHRACMDSFEFLVDVGFSDSLHQTAKTRTKALGPTVEELELTDLQAGYGFDEDDDPSMTQMFESELGESDAQASKRVATSIKQAGILQTNEKLAPSSEQCRFY